MTTTQIKTEIQKKLNNAPENVLADVLDYINQLETRSNESILQNKNIHKIFKEDRELLKRLAQ
jgi:hypothetical protein